MKRGILEKLTECLFTEGSERRFALQRFIESYPELDDYARFRAAGERQGLPWTEWSRPLRHGVLSPGDYDDRARRYHLYVQWLAHEQIGCLAAKAREKGPGLYLDLPLGVHPHGYDVWRFRGLFAENISGGAPPDAVFTKGQDWGFPPLQPGRIREDGYRYVIDYLSHMMQQAGLLRIDHVMGLHRIYWIPKELDASQGAYVRYPAEELYAISTLESHRNRCCVVGENLGTVPAYVNRAMSRHNVHKMYVLQYELESKHPMILQRVPANSTASLNTHDMPPFAAYWRGLDIQDRQEIGLLNAEEAQQERKTRQTIKKRLEEFLMRKGRLKGRVTARSALRASLAYLSASPARIVLVNLEDLWLETEPQNVPTAREERPNWRRKARYRLEDLQRMPPVIDTLSEINRLRKKQETTKGKE